MKQIYQVVTIYDHVPCCDEWINYEGSDLEQARTVLDRESRYNDKEHYTEIRAYNSVKTFNEMDEQEYINTLNQGYEIIK